MLVPVVHRPTKEVMLVEVRFRNREIKFYRFLRGEDNEMRGKLND